VIRLVTWNLWWRFGPWRERGPAVETVLRHATPDLVTLQEVHRGDDVDQLASLGDALDLPHRAWSPNRVPARWRRRAGDDARDAEVGVALLSRWPLLEVTEADLPDAGAEAEGRTALGAVVEHPDGPLPLVTTHLSSSPAGSAVRVEQVRAVAALVRHLQQRVADPRPPVVTGDFNAEPESDEMRLLGGHLTAPSVPGLVLVDAWRLAPGDGPGWTWRRENPYLGPGNPDARIDHVLVGLGTAVGRATLVGAGPQDVDGAPVWPSDHAGVLVDLDPATRR
jgi:endonuclease/exonuclease/phosphatase family metal-dependent hydrolase